MIPVGAVVWFVGRLFADIIFFFYPPILFVCSASLPWCGATESGVNQPYLFAQTRSGLKSLSSIGIGHWTRSYT